MLAHGGTVGSLRILKQAPVAQAFNNFYHQHHILSETDRERKVFLLWMTKFFLEELGRVLDIMGIPAPEIM